MTLIVIVCIVCATLLLIYAQAGIMDCRKCKFELEKMKFRYEMIKLERE